MWKDPIKYENFKVSDSQEFMSQKEVILPSAKEVTQNQLPEILPLLPLLEETNPSLSGKPVVILPKENAEKCGIYMKHRVYGY